MWVADMDFRIAPCIAEALRQRLNHGVLGYTLRTQRFGECVANWQEQRNNWHINPDWVTFCPGVVAGIAVAISQFTQPNDKVIVQTPVYHPFFLTVRALGRQVVYNPLLNHATYARIDFADLEQKARGAKMLLLCNPHNPGGRVWTPDELRQVAEICNRNGVMVVSDEIHSDLIYSHAHFTPYASIDETAAQNSITLSAPSKTFNIAGLATSYAVVPNATLLRRFNAGLNAMHIGYGNVFGLVALEAAYSDGKEWLNQLLRYLSGNIDYAISFAERNFRGISIARPESTFLLWCDCRNLELNSKQLTDFFAHRAKVAVNMGDMFGAEGTGFVRLNIGCTRATLQLALERIADALNKLPSV
jgi:cystathionine beta-lyase